MDKYLFTPGGNVSPKDFYTEERGFGFITEQVMENVPHLMLPELNGGFMPVPWYRRKLNKMTAGASSAGQKLLQKIRYSTQI